LHTYICLYVYTGLQWGARRLLPLRLIVSDMYVSIHTYIHTHIHVYTGLQWGAGRLLAERRIEM
jgi:hypothetical protein